TVPMTGVTVTNPGGSNGPDAGEGVQKIIDEQPSTKWLDGNRQPVIFEFPEAVTVDGYRFMTANDAPPRDPVSWLIHGSDDGENWDLLDVRTDHEITTDRFTWITPLE